MLVWCAFVLERDKPGREFDRMGAGRETTERHRPGPILRGRSEGHRRPRSAIDQDGCNTSFSVDPGRVPKRDLDMCPFVAPGNIDRPAMGRIPAAEDLVLFDKRQGVRRRHSRAQRDQQRGQTPYATVEAAEFAALGPMTALDPELADRLVARRTQLRRLMSEVRWLKRAAIILAGFDIVVLGAVLWRMRWETFGG